MQTPNSQSRYALLTYDLLAPESERGLVLLSAESFEEELTHAQKESLAKLRRNINDVQRLNASGRMDQAKSLVRLLAAGEVNYEGKAVAIHRFGPVPVLAIDLNQHHRLPSGKEVRLRLGLYAAADRSAPNYRKLPEGSPSGVHFLASLKLRTGLVFRRYFEDVAEMLWAIQHKADLGLALAWGKQVETVLAESVNSKLEAILPKRPKKGNQHKAEQELAETILREQAAVILQAAYGRLLVLYILNWMYEILGIRSKSVEYRDQLRSFRRNMTKFPAHVVEELFNNDEVLHELSHIFSTFDESISYESAAPMSFHSSEVGWVEQVARFARFLTVLRKRASTRPKDSPQVLDPRFAKVFFSSVHLVPSGVQVYEKLEAIIRESKKHVRLLAVQEPPDTAFRELILARLWLSDALLAVLPREPRRFDDSTGGYDWIGKEAALALLTNRSDSFALESGTMRTVVEEAFRSIDNDLFPWMERKEASERLAKEFNESVHVEFEVTDPSRPLDDRLGAQLDRIVERALVERSDKLVRGFLEQFPPDLRAHFRYLRRARQPHEASWFVGILKGIRPIVGEELDETTVDRATRKFYSLFKAASSRALVLNAKTYPLMSSDKRKRRKKHLTKYTWELPNILRELRPWASDEELGRWEDDLVRWSEETIGGRGPVVS